MTRVNPVFPFPQTSPTKLWRDFREYVAVVFASRRPHSTLVWPGRGQAHKTWLWRSLPPVIPGEEGFCVIHPVRAGSSAGGWCMVIHIPFGCRNHRVKFSHLHLPDHLQRSSLELEERQVCHFSRGYLRRSFPVLLSSILHLAVALQLFLRRESMGHAKTPPSHPQDHYNCLSDEPWALLGLIQRNSRKLNPQQIKRVQWYLGTSLNFDIHVFNSILHQWSPLNTKTVSCMTSLHGIWL